MKAGKGKGAEKTKGRSLNVLSAIRKSIVVFKAAFLCLPHALIIGMARVNGDPKYQSYRDEYLLGQPADELLRASGGDYPMEEALRNFNSFRITIRTTKLLLMTV